MPDQDDSLDSDTLTGAGAQPPPRKADAPKHVVFTPGITIAGRYRIATLLGEGGMGEVYRADDLTLNQAVALKFLPRKLANDPAALARFHGEVRTARQIAHPSVCRVFDIGEAEGRLFLTMEYIDGEDLASLLRRIGRLASDKALELARQICAGVAAAHDAGVLHRDLKPANVMIDGRGRAHITDFGVAGLAADLRGDMSRAGTPAYMAPEQLAGKGVSEQSDIFSLGLILYGMFTGKRAFGAGNAANPLRMHDSAPSRPSTLVGDIDPLAERIILRCLERDPAQRPRTALDVARALPGGDPLAAALAAGETPSPEMVAAAGGEGAIEARHAWMLLGGFALILTAIFAVSPYSRDLNYAPIDKTPEMLAERASTIVQKAGYEPATDSSYSLGHNSDYLNYRAKHLPAGKTIRDLPAQAPTPYVFFYRQSPRWLIPRQSSQFVWTTEPPLAVAGMVTMILSSRGELVSFVALPPQTIAAEAWTKSYPPVDWNQWLVEAGLDPSRFQPEEPIWAPLMAYDTRAGFRGSYTGDPGTVIHVIANSFQGKAVYFAVTGPWSRASRDTAASQDNAFNVTRRIFVGIQVLLVAIALYLARRNWNLGRSDMKGATRLGLAIALAQLAARLCIMHYVPQPEAEWSAILELMGRALFDGALSMLGYLAIEPFLRRTWPAVLTTWARLISGAVRDPRIGRDVLAGGLLGTLDALLVHFKYAVPVWFHLPGQIGMDSDLNMPRVFAGLLFLQVNNGAQSAIFPMLILFVLRIVLRRSWATAAGGLAIFAIISFTTGDPIISGVYAIASAIIMVFTGMRLGLVAMAASQTLNTLLTQYPLVLDPGRWYFGRTAIVVGLCVALAIYAFRISLGGKSPFGAWKLDAD